MAQDILGHMRELEVGALSSPVKKRPLEKQNLLTGFME